MVTVQQCLLQILLYFGFFIRIVRLLNHIYFVQREWQNGGNDHCLLLLYYRSCRVISYVMVVVCLQFKKVFIK
jgi:hypothetical protein